MLHPLSFEPVMDYDAVKVQFVLLQCSSIQRQHFWSRYSSAGILHPGMTATLLSLTEVGYFDLQKDPPISVLLELSSDWSF